MALIDPVRNYIMTTWVLFCKFGVSKFLDLPLKKCIVVLKPFWADLRFLVQGYSYTNTFSYNYV